MGRARNHFHLALFGDMINFLHCMFDLLAERPIKQMLNI